MGSTSTDNPNPSSLYESSSSPSHPLLSKPQIDPNDNQTIESEPNQYPEITFNHNPRKFQDLPFLFLFLILSLSTFAFGIFSIFNQNPNSSKITSFVYDNSTSSCVKESLQNHFFQYELGFSSSSSLLKDLIWTLVITFLLSGPLALFLLFSLRHYTKQIVYISIPLFILIPIFLNVFWFVACAVSTNCRDSFPLVYRILILVFVFLIIGVFIWIIVANWHRIELTVRIMGVGAEALGRNLGLFLVLPSLSVGLVVYFVPIVVFLVFSRLNGKIVPKVVSEDYSCVWKQDSWVPAYFALAIVTMIWSLATMVEAQVYVISGTIAQWYFSKEGSTPSRSIRGSMRNAFGPSFGTVCFSGLLIGAVRVIRAAVDIATREDAVPGIVNLILRCCVNFLLSGIDFLNKFTINFTAITGEGYCSSAKMTYELLKRNLLSAVFVETISTRILIGIIFVLSAIYAVVVFVILRAVSALGVEVYFVAVLAWLLLILVLGFFVHVLDGVIETVYVCYAIDRDKGDVCKQEVHEVYVLLPTSRNDRHSHDNRTPFRV
ncbi:plasma-membrane choline transporter family protein [Tasmannia lanceolata]|uniref:plasma-membrane choline transporter family protein n=1 Tax=Tasmannia lanceolata TaxID=3420 RepID=UPI004062D474